MPVLAASAAAHQTYRRNIQNGRRPAASGVGRRRVIMFLRMLIALGCGLGVSAWAQPPSLAKTPPMGWNSWNRFGREISDSVLRAQADAMVGRGLKGAGYIYLNIDDGWAGERDSRGVIHPNRNFPD